MDYSLKEVAGRIRDLREAKGYTQEELANLCGITTEDYKVLELGETDFSFTFIYKCAKACGVEVVDLLEGTSTTLTSFAITRKGEGLKIVKKHGVEYNNLAPKFREKLAEPFLVKFPYLEEEQNASMQLNSHNGQEFDVIVKGLLKKEIQEYVKTHTAPYKYPRIVEFVDELPKTISGKVRRVEIRKNDMEKLGK